MTDHPPAQAGVPAIEMTGVAVGALRDPDTTVAEGINWTVTPAITGSWPGCTARARAIS